MKLFFVIILVFFTLLSIFNLPPSDNINDFISKKSESNFLEKLSTSLLFSQNVADWTYRDLIFIKFACSDRLGVELIAIPFKKWKIYRKEVKSCD